MEFNLTRASLWPDSQPLTEESLFYKKLKKSTINNTTKWSIEINSLDELLALMHEVGDLVINESDMMLTLNNAQFQ